MERQAEDGEQCESVPMLRIFNMVEEMGMPMDQGEGAKQDEGLAGWRVEGQCLTRVPAEHVRAGMRQMLGRWSQADMKVS